MKEMNPWDYTTLSDIQKLKKDSAWLAVRAFYLQAFNDLIDELDDREDSRFVDGQVVMVKRFLGILELFETKLKENQDERRREDDGREG